MRLLAVLCLLSFAIALVPAAEAGPEWLPVCKDKDVGVRPYVHVHVGLDCYPGLWVDVCPPGKPCERYDVWLS